MTSESRHVRSLTTAESVYDGELGSLTRLDANSFPMLNRMSIKKLVLAPGVIREPHWHANANELTYCLSGTALVTVFDNADEFSSFTITAGQMFHVDSGALHHIENIGDDEAQFIVVFSHERPEDFSLRGAFGAMTDAVLGNTFDLPSDAWAGVPRDTSSPLLVKRQGDPVVPDTAGWVNRHKFDVEGQQAPLKAAVGSAHLARQQFWPALKNLSMYSLRIEEEGMREPHWHPVTAEMGYVHAGHARMSVLDPDGTVDTYLLEPGDVYFIPRAYPHQIEVIGDDEIHFLVFFDQPTPGDIGFRASGSVFSREVLAASFGVAESALPQLPFTPIDPLIVGKKNPTDPLS
jgi:oxalate decarboxylase